MARELWIGVDDDGITLVFAVEPGFSNGSFYLPAEGDATYVDREVSKMFGIPPGHKAKLVLDEASVTKGGE